MFMGIRMKRVVPRSIMPSPLVGAEVFLFHADDML